MKKIISDVKSHFNRLPKPGKIFVSILLLVLAYKFVRNMFRKAAVKKEVNEYEKAGGVVSNSGLAFNSKACAISLWDLFYNGWTESESKIVKTLKDVPVYKRTEVNKLYQDYKLHMGHNPQNLFCVGNSCLVVFHYGKNLQADAQYYLGSKYREVEDFFNSL